MIQLHDYPLSGNCYKVRLLLHWLGLPYETLPVDFYPGLEHRSARFIDTVNPRGQLPVLRDGDFLLPDAQAILVYLASRYDTARHWYPDDAATRGRITVWLALADELTRTASAARLHHAFGFAADLPGCTAGALAAFQLLDDHLAEQAALGEPWLAGVQPTIADIACFPYVALASEAHLDLMPFAALRAWVDRLRHLPGFIGMAGILAPAL